jgi:hypothetical protein
MPRIGGLGSHMVGSASPPLADDVDDDASIDLSPAS